MKAFLYTLYLKTKLDIKNMEILIAYYLVPLVFFAVMGAVFTAIMPDAKQTIIATLTIFAVTMGALIGTPGSIIDYFKNDTRKSFKSAGIPMESIVIAAIVSGFVNLTVTSAIIYFVSPVAFAATRPENLGVYISGFFLLLLSTVLVGIIIGLYAKTSSKLTMYSQLVFLPSLMLSGIMFPSNMLPMPLQYLGLLFPATHGMKILSGEAFVSSNYLVLLLFIVVSGIVIKLRMQKLRYEDAR